MSKVRKLGEMEVTTGLGILPIGGFELPTPEDFEAAAATFRAKPEPVATAILSTIVCDNCGPDANYNASAAGLFCVECGAECFEITLDAILEL